MIFSCSIDDIKARQHTDPNAIAWRDEVLDFLKRDYKLKPLEVDGKGFCLFNSAFVCLWTIGRRRDFQNGEDLFKNFIDYCYSNSERFTATIIEIIAIYRSFDIWVNRQIRPIKNTTREGALIILAEFLRVNIMLLSNERHSCTFYRAGDNNILTTIAIYHIGTAQGGHFVPLIPT